MGSTFGGVVDVRFTLGFTLLGGLTDTSLFHYRPIQPRSTSVAPARSASRRGIAKRHLQSLRHLPARDGDGKLRTIRSECETKLT